MSNYGPALITSIRNTKNVCREDILLCSEGRCYLPDGTFTIFIIVFIKYDRTEIVVQFNDTLELQVLSYRDLDNMWFSKIFLNKVYVIHYNGKIHPCIQDIGICSLKNQSFLFTVFDIIKSNSSCLVKNNSYNKQLYILVENAYTEILDWNGTKWINQKLPEFVVVKFIDVV